MEAGAVSCSLISSRQSGRHADRKRIILQCYDVAEKERRKE